MDEVRDLIISILGQVIQPEAVRGARERGEDRGERPGEPGQQGGGHDTQGTGGRC